MTTTFSKKTARSKRRLSLAIFMVLLLFSFSCPGKLGAGEFYRWIDENGVVHVSDTFPQASSKGGKQEVQRVNVPVNAPVNVPAPKGSQTDEYQIPFSHTPTGGIIVKGVFDDAINVTMLFDTGASHMVISETLARQLDPSSPVVRKVKVQTAGGPIEARMSMISKVALGDVFKENVPAVVTDRDPRPMGFDAILGLSFLQDFRATVDYQNRVIILKRH
ncbi:clan AA aspartic protease, TIGR02281 family [Syntrophus gentianae]|uniref:Clan AA aspartic protease, TIGR02281 family n=1 Tax=Syntrophus gentianae TaxID=43775 RepID=A0A1H7WGE3_9BACT|nr:aspartyl protease family protein [Syntrophus gentianae]SEM20540.1 clan AA aspartic protease, TIGR02281 family [Syntrophus gentianae]